MTGAVTLHRVLLAKPERVYRTNGFGIPTFLTIPTCRAR